MLLTLPIYVETRRDAGRLVHHCRPLFFDGQSAADVHLGLAMSKLQKRLKQYLDPLGAHERHDALAACAFAPDLKTRVAKLSLSLREQVVKCKFLFVDFAALGRRVAFTPALPHLWFEVNAAQQFDDRAQEVLSTHFRGLEKASARALTGPSSPAELSLQGSAWVATMDVRVPTQPATEKKIQRQLAALFDESRPSGGAELQRVGRCLDWLYPAELHQAVMRDREVAQLDRLLMLPDNRPVVLVGPRLVGKTTLVHECVRRRVARRGKPYSARRNVWLISPQRLISGMMYVGQWEGRVQAILREARKRRHVLYFDDFLGLYHAGISRDASLSVADVLKPYLLRREVRVLAELTPEAWQKLQERDRGLADQFHVLRLEPTGEEETRRVMLGVHRQLEVEHRCEFDLEALPAIVQLHQSYFRDAAFPGKSAAFSQRLARKRAGQAITRNEVFQEFHEQSGLSLDLLDDRRRWDQRTVLDAMRRKIIGQPEAVATAADVMTLAKAHLANPSRPLATLLFLGPTGVGKTQCAKALAEVMFGHEGRLLRFDMNEYVTPHATGQLMGTFADPEGLLTAAVRRQPFSVVLLDEIEKAHADVFDLLLQVTGEGRLTDARGRTVDFSHTVIVMTSNLGTTAGQTTIGLTETPASAQHRFVRAAENFFRPEFFNRIDRIVPFEPLTREQMRAIAQLLLADVFQRDGLVRRRCVLAVEEAAMERIVDAGYHPQFGARALKRALERQLVQPVAVSLAAVQPELPAIVGVHPHGKGVTALVQPLESVASVAGSVFTTLAPGAQLANVEQFASRIEAELSAHRPGGNTVARGMTPEQLRYFALKEQLHRVRELAAWVGEHIQASGGNIVRPDVAPKTPTFVRRSAGAMRGVSERRMMLDLHAAQDIHDFLNESAAAITRPEELEQRLTALRHECALLQALVTSTETPDRVLLMLRPLVREAQAWSRQLASSLAALASHLAYDYELKAASADGSDPTALLLSGPGIWPLAAAEAGVHILCRRHENLLPVQVALFPTEAGTLAQQLAARCGEREAWLAQLAAGIIEPVADPWPLGAIVRFYDEGGSTLDLRTGVSIPHLPQPPQWRSLLLAGLPLPPEMEVIE